MDASVPDGTPVEEVHGYGLRATVRLERYRREGDVEKREPLDEVAEAHLEPEDVRVLAEYEGDLGVWIHETEAGRRFRVALHRAAVLTTEMNA